MYTFSECVLRKRPCKNLLIFFVANNIHFLRSFTGVHTSFLLAAAKQKVVKIIFIFGMSKNYELLFIQVVFIQSEDIYNFSKKHLRMNSDRIFTLMLDVYF